MANKRISELASTATLPAGAQFLLSRPSPTVTKTAATISFNAADKSINDSGNGFVTAGFVAGDQVKVTGAANGGNNVASATCTVASAGKLTTNATTFVTEAAGASVTVTKWESVRMDQAELVAALAGGDAATTDYTPAVGADWVDPDPTMAAGALDQLAGRVTDLEGSSGGVATDAIWDAAGDLAVGSGANTAAKLSKGSALQVLRVNSGATALEWAAPAAPSLNVQTVTSAATVTPASTNDLVEVTAQAEALTVANPSGTPANGWGMAIRVKDNGTARAITWGGDYLAIGVTLPATTVAGKQHYIGAVYNSTAAKWDVVSVGVQA